MFDANKATRAVRFFENLKHTKGRFHGQPFLLLDWQRELIGDVYGTVNDAGYRQYKYIYLEVPKKNGKSEMAAAAGLYHTFADKEVNGEIYGCASDRAQASIVFDVAVDMIEQVPALKKRAKLTLSQKLITDKVTGSFYKVVSSEAYTKHGLNVSAVIFDELHAQPNRDLWDVMTFGAGDARTQPIWWIITTAGDDPDRVSVGWEQHEYAERLINGDVVDRTWYPVIYGYDGPDIYNEDNWRKANPSLGQTITVESVREAAEKARKRPADERLFRWLRLNQWLTTKLTTWLPLDLFDATTDKAMGRDDLNGRQCFVGMDLSSTTDLTAICAVFPPQSELDHWYVIWEGFIPRENMRERIERDNVPYALWETAGWLTATDGNVIDYNYIEKKVIEWRDLYDIKMLVSDPAQATMLLQRLMAAGIDCVSMAQTFVNLTDPMNLIETLLRTGEMRHEPNPVARWCFGNTSIAKNGQGYIKFVKETKGRSVIRTHRIDMTAAWVNAMGQAKNHEALTSAYEDEGIFVL